MESVVPALESLDVQGKVRLSGKVIARQVSYDTFLRAFEGQRVEWVNGVVIEMASIDERHDALVEYLRIMFRCFLELTGGGRVLGDPLVMRLDSVPSSRAPDVQVLLPDRLGQLRQKEVVGPASLVVEVLSEGSQRTDQVDKRREYELGGVPEYWLIDFLKRDVTLLHLTASGLYTERLPDDKGVYASYVLAGFTLNPALLWQDKLPTVLDIVSLVERMLKR